MKKGVSEVIAIILILMIVIALAALAYTWFSGIFASLTGTASTAVTQTTNTMATQFSIENVIQNPYTGTSINFVIRNIGTQNIVLDTLNAYTGDGTPLTESTTGTLASNARSNTLTVNSAPPCSTCSGHICYYGSNPQTLRITFASGLENSAIVTC